MKPARAQAGQNTRRTRAAQKQSGHRHLQQTNKCQQVSRAPSRRKPLAGKRKRPRRKNEENSQAAKRKPKSRQPSSRRMRTAGPMGHCFHGDRRPKIIARNNAKCARRGYRLLNPRHNRSREQADSDGLQSAPCSPSPIRRSSRPDNSSSRKQTAFLRAEWTPGTSKTGANSTGQKPRLRSSC